MLNVSVKRTLAVGLCILCTVATALAENIRVKVIDAKTKAPLPGAAVQIEGTYIGEPTDGEGNCVIRNQKPGTYVLLVQYVAYEPKRVEGVVVQRNLGADVSIELAPESIEVDAVRVVAQANRESEGVLVAEQREALVPSISLGAQELSRKGLGSAQAAVERVAGVSKQDGVKNVFVRGLGDRYNLTLFNGYPIPSEDPEYKNISLDFFSSDIIQNVSVSKVFTGRQNGNVAGAIIDISSKELLKRYGFSVNASLGGNAALTAKRFVRQDGVGYFGFASAAHPKEVGRDVYVFENKLEPSRVAVPLSHSYGLSGGYRWELDEGKHSLALFAVGSYSSDFSYTKSVVRNAVFTASREARVTQDQEGEKFSSTIQQLALFNATARLARRHQLEYNLLYVHSSNQYVSEMLGSHAERYADADEYDYRGFMRRQQVNDNQLLVSQLAGKFELIPNLNFNVGTSYNMVIGNEPDRRESNLSYQGNGFYHETLGDSQRRFFSKLFGGDLNLTASFSYILPDKFDSRKSKVEVGYVGRTLAATTFAGNNYAPHSGRQKLQGNPVDFPFDGYYLDGTHGKMNVNAIPVESYKVGKNIHGAYVDASYQIVEAFNIAVGCRYDHVLMGVIYNTLVDGEGENELQQSFWLPSINLRYDPSESHTIRMGASRSYTIPQDKEISPFEYVNIGFTSKGNPKLRSATSYNVDLRWDYLFNSSDYVALVGYFKHILDPISRINIAGSGNKLSYDNVSKNAQVAGGELEVRATPLRTTAKDAQHELIVGLTAAYIYTTQRILTASVDRRTNMEGAAPLVGNLDLTYRVALPKVEFSLALVGSYFFDRIYTIGMWGYSDIIEQGRPQLDFVFSTKLAKAWSISVKGRNLINPPIKLTRQFAGSSEPFLLERGYKGRSFSLGVSYSLGPR